MKKRNWIALSLVAIMTTTMLSGCGAGETGSAETAEAAVTEATESTEAAEEGTSSDAEGGVLRVGMECAYPPFNWTQDEATTPDGSKAVKIYGSDYYAYGYDVAVAQKLADELGMELEIHKVEWSSIGISMDAGDYDCIIAGMGRTAEREMSYSFTEPYYYRDNCIVVKKDGPYANVKGLSELNGTGCKLTTQLGTAYIDLISQIPDAKQAAFYETTSEAFMAVSNGVADAALIDVPTSESALLTNSDLEILKIDDMESGSSVNVCIAVRTGDKELQDLIQGALDDLNWNEENRAQMDDMMSLAVSLQPAAK